MVSWYLMNGKPVYNSGFEREEHFAYAYDGFNEALDTTALGDDVIVYHNGIIEENNAIHIKAIVQNNSSDVLDNDKVKQILVNINTLFYGDYIYYKNKYYLVTDVPGDNKIYEKAIMQQCNYLLKWVNDEGEIIRQWSIFRNVTKEYATGLSETKAMALGVMTAGLYLPKNNETIRLKLGDRLIIDDLEHAQLFHPNVYRITKLNLVQKNDYTNALFIYTLEDTQFNIAKDNKELMIADYYNRIRQYGIELITPEWIEIPTGASFDLQAHVTINGVCAPGGGITLVSLDDSIVEIDGAGAIGKGAGETVILAQAHGVTKEVRARVVPVADRYQSVCHIEFEGEPALRAGLEKRFTARFYGSDGQETNDIPLWFVLDKDGAEPTWITKRMDDNNVWLKTKTVGWIVGEEIELVLTGSGGLTRDTLTLEIVTLT